MRDSDRNDLLSRLTILRIRRTTAILAVLAAGGACRAHGDMARTPSASTLATGSAAPSAATVPSAIVTALDSCALPLRKADESDSAVRATIARSNVMLEGTVRSFGSYALFIPDSARVNTVDTLPGRLSLVWPDCPGCRFAVTIATDATHGGLEGRIAKIVARQRAIDSINRLPNQEAAEFNEVDGPPTPFTTPTWRGYVIDADCGDCVAESVLFGRPGQIASISFGGSDDIPDGRRHFCEMTAVAKSFEWRDGVWAPR